MAKQQINRKQRRQSNNNGQNCIRRNQKESLFQSRLSSWVALTVFSVITIVSLTTSRDKSSWNADFRYCLAMATISLIKGSIGSLYHILILLLGSKNLTRGYLLEMVLGISALVIWAVCLPTINGLAVNDSLMIENANLYFSSWGAFFAAVHILVHFSREQYPATTTARKNDYDYLQKWGRISLSSLIALSAASQLVRDAQCTRRKENLRDDDYCNDLKIGLWLCIFATFAAFFMSVVTWRGFVVDSSREKVPSSLVPGVECFIASLLLSMWSICIAYLTFGKGPAAPIGTLFLSVWSSFILSVDLVVFHANKILANQAASLDVNTNDDSKNHCCCCCCCSKPDDLELTENPTTASHDTSEGR